MQDTAPTILNRRWPRFSLRTLFALVTVVAVVAGWLVVQLQWVADRHAALEALSLAHSSTPDVPAPWSIRWIEPGAAMIQLDPVTARNHAHLRELRRLFPEARLYMIVPEKLPGSSISRYAVKEL